MSIMNIFGDARWQLLIALNHLTSRFWLPTPVVRCTRRPHTPHYKRVLISRTAAACEQLKLSASEVRTFNWILFLSPSFSEFRPLRHTKSRGVDRHTVDKVWTAKAEQNHELLRVQHKKFHTRSRGHPRASKRLK